MSSEQVNEEDTASLNLDNEEEDSEEEYTILEDASEKSEIGDTENINQITEESEYYLLEDTGGELLGEEDNVKPEEDIIQIDEKQIGDIVNGQDFSQGDTSDLFQNTSHKNDDKTEIEEIEKDGDQELDKSMKSEDNSSETDVDEEDELSDSETSSEKKEKPELQSEHTLSLSETRRSSSLLCNDQGHYLEEDEFKPEDAKVDISSSSSESSESFISVVQTTEKLHDYVKKHSNLYKRISTDEEPCDKDTEKTLLKVDVQELISGYKTEDELMKDSLTAISGLVKIRQDLICIENEPIILRKDYKSYKGVRILSGGHMGHEPLFADYVGKGMLTGVVLGSLCDPPSVAAVTKAMQELATHSPGLLIITLNSVEYRLIFSLAIEYLKMEGYSNIEMVAVADDCYESRRSPVGRRGLAGIILLYKLAGSMADSDKTLLEIFKSVGSASKTINTISCMTKPFKIIGCGMAKNTKVGINFNGDHTQMIRRMMDYCLSSTKHFSMRLEPNDSLIVLINNYRSLSPAFYKIVDRVIKVLESRNVNISRVYANNFITGYWPGFSITLMIDVYEYTMKYLDSPTSVSLWPKNPSDGSLSSYNLSYEKKKFQEMGPILSHREMNIFKTALVSACKSLILCETELNRMHFFGNYGTKLKYGAEAVLIASRQSLINFSRPFNLLIEISEILVESIPGATGAMYGCLFEGAARSFLKNDLTTVTSQSWTEAMDAALKTLKAYTNAKEGIISLTLSLIPKLMSLGAPFREFPQAIRVNPILNILEPLRREIANRTKELENNNSKSRLQNQLNVELYAIIILLHAIYSSLYWKYHPSIRYSTEEDVKPEVKEVFKKSTDKISIKRELKIKKRRSTKQSKLYKTDIIHRSIDNKADLSVLSEGINECDFITEEFEGIEDFESFDDQMLSEQTVDNEEKSFYTDISEATEEQSFIPT